MAKKLTPGKPLPKGQKSQYEMNRPGVSKTPAAPAAPVQQMGMSRKPTMQESYLNQAPQTLPRSYLPPQISPEGYFQMANQAGPQSVLPPDPNQQMGMSQRSNPFQQPVNTQQPLQGQQGGNQSVLPPAAPNDTSGTTPNSQTGAAAPTAKFESQPYQYEFFTKEGQQERLMNAIETSSLRNPMTSPTLFMGKYVPGVSEGTTAAIDALNVAGILYAGVKVFQVIATMNKVGALAGTTAGARSLASTIPEASGAVPPWLAKASLEASPALNTATSAISIGGLSKLLFQTNAGRGTVGAVILMAGLAGQTDVKKDMTDYIKDSGELAVKLREVGMLDLADELAASNRDLKNGLDVVIPYIPYIGKNIEKGKIMDYRDRLNEINLKYDAAVKAEREAEIQKTILSEQQAAELKRQQDQADLADKRAYEEKQLLDKRAYDEQQQTQKFLMDEARTREERQYAEYLRQDQRDYNEAQVAEQRRYNDETMNRQAEAAYRAEATATETSQPSTLTFGLLGTSGAVEFVDRDKASQVYFGKVYDELTIEQKMLLNLLKGKK